MQDWKSEGEILPPTHTLKSSVPRCHHYSPPLHPPTSTPSCICTPHVQVSAIVRAPPSDVFAGIVQQRRRREGVGVLIGARVVETIDDRNQIVTQRWQPVGVLGRWVGGCG